jgi:hypothetical protein
MFFTVSNLYFKIISISEQFEQFKYSSSHGKELFFTSFMIKNVRRNRRSSDVKKVIKDMIIMNYMIDWFIMID